MENITKGSFSCRLVWVTFLHNTKRKFSSIELKESKILGHEFGQCFFFETKKKSPVSQVQRNLMVAKNFAQLKSKLRQFTKAGATFCNKDLFFEGHFIEAPYNEFLS